MDVLGQEFLLRFGIHSIALLVLLKYTFFRYTHDRDSLFSFMLFGHGVFIVAGLLHNVEISMGFAFGLFAVFSMLRYRTESISVRNMTYLFLVIVISLISSVGPVSHTELVLINILICILTWVCETRILAVRHEVATITYPKMKMLKPQKRAELIADLIKMTGLDIQAVEIIDRNYNNKTAKLKVFYAKATPEKKFRESSKESPQHEVSPSTSPSTSPKSNPQSTAYLPGIER